ncbi:MAG: transglycosylase domain-containing protein [Candidatus Babeliaceae bacterium]|nr:transglycosylase domain-containing protein [Candidatus Babeliaceae bacterium]
MHILKAIFFYILISSCFLSGMLVYLFTHVSVDFSILENYDPGKYSIVLDDSGNELTRFQLDRREPVSLETISPFLIQAFLAAEDQNFFDHHGVSLRGMLRSFIANFTHGKIVQGASTITQQLIKLLFLDNRRTFERKFKELFLALIAEHQFSKEQILQTYLNHIYLGGGIYGVEAASQRFWNKSCRDITVAQAATLAGIVQSPERLCPLTCPERSLARRNSILYRMFKQKKITLQDYEFARKEPLGLQDTTADCCAPHIKQMIAQMVEHVAGKKVLYTGGLVIQTTISKKIQQKSNLIFMRHIKHNQKYTDVSVDGGFVIIEGACGKIKALVGGKNFYESQFNRVTHAKRQLGSIFKPLIYAQAIDNGARMDDICLDEPVTLELNNTQWSPRNYNNTFIGPVTRAYGLYRSLNTVAIQTLFTAGIDSVINAAQRCGISHDIVPYPSLALGCVDATLLQAAAMFNCFAQQGTYYEPYYIEWIKNSQGKKIFRHKPVERQALNWFGTSQVSAALAARITQLQKKQPAGNSLNAFKPGTLIGKTGTTNDARSTFYVGATPNYTAAAYFGNDDYRSMGTHIFASQTVMPLVIDVLKATDGACKDYFKYHPDLQPAIIDEITGQKTDPDNPQAIEILIPRA